jgi:SAM-dependent methyltransferase
VPLLKEGWFCDYKDKVALSLYRHHVCKLVEELGKNTIVILEPGSGIGRFSLIIAEDLKSNGISPYVIGVDLLEGILKNAKKTFAQNGISAEFVVADLRHLPFKNESFDFVHSQGVCEHFMKSDRQGVFDEMANALKTEGLFFIIVPNGLNIFWRFEFALSRMSSRLGRGPLTPNELPFTMKELAGRLAQAGLAITRAGALDRDYTRMFGGRMALMTLGRIVRYFRVETRVPQEDFTRVDRDYGHGNAWLIMGRDLWAFAKAVASIRFDTQSKSLELNHGSL